MEQNGIYLLLLNSRAAISSTDPGLRTNLLAVKFFCLFNIMAKDKLSE